MATPVEAGSWIASFDGPIDRNDFDPELGGTGSAGALLRASLGALLDSVVCRRDGSRAAEVDAP